jgi:hypothetical protein
MAAKRLPQAGSLWMNFTRGRCHGSTSLQERDRPSAGKVIGRRFPPEIKVSRWAPERLDRGRRSLPARDHRSTRHLALQRPTPGRRANIRACRVLERQVGELVASTSPAPILARANDSHCKSLRATPTEPRGARRRWPSHRAKPPRGAARARDALAPAHEHGERPPWTCMRPFASGDHALAQAAMTG